MKHKCKIFYVISFAVLSFCIGGCAQKEFDAAGYVKGMLDAEFHGEYAAYAKHLELSEEEAKSNGEQRFKENIQMQFSGMDKISEEDKEEYGEMVRKIDDMAKYEILEANKTEDGNYTVKLQVEPSDIYQTLEQSSTEVSNEKIAQGLDESDTKVFVSVLTESIQRSIDKNAYGQKEEIEVLVKKDGGNTYSVGSEEMDKIRAALFPQN